MNTKIKKLSKKTISILLVCSLILGIYFPNLVNAKESISIDVTKNPKIDIVVTSNETTVNMNTFQQDLFSTLESKGIKTDDITIESVSREEISSNAADASTIFNNWGRIGMTGQWSLTTVSNIPTIQNAENTATLTGFYYPDSYDATKIKITFDARSTDSDNDVLGCMFRFNITSEGTTNQNKKCTTYIFLQDGGEGYPGGLYKLENYYFDAGGHPGTKSSLTGIDITSSHKFDTNFKKLASTSTKWTRNTWSSYEIVCNKNNIKIYQNNKLLINYTDTSSTPIESGSYGFFSWSQPKAQYKNFVASTSNAKAFKDILLAPNWREDAEHCIINVDDIVDETFTNQELIGEILTRTINDNIRFIQWGTDTNKDIMESFINQNNNNGLFVDNTNYSLAVEKTANYIESFCHTNENENLVVVNDPIDLDITPANLKTNTSDSEYPNGKWIIHHNAKYYANGAGQSEYSEQYQDDLNIVFDKPGQYGIYYGEDLVKTVYAHRLPIASFNMTLNSDKTLSLENISYDLDSNEDKNGLGNGIEEIQWQWKNLNDSEWTNGEPTIALVDGESYMVQLKVKDEQGAWSNPVAKYITLDETIEVPPVASFNFGSSTIFTNKELEILDSSYDPKGLNLTQYEWILKKGKVVISTSATPTLSFNTSTLGVGDYTYTLKVKNSDNVWSEAYTKSFTVIEDTIAPSVMIDPTYSEWGESSAINFEFMDSGSGFAKFRYTHSETQTQPNDNDASWSTWSTNDNGSLTIQEDGVWYLHLQAYDNNNNLLTRTVGVYRIDTANPTIDNVIFDENSFGREIPITVIAHDETSGIKYYRFVNETTGEDSGYIESNIYNATTNGIYKVYVKDKNNNEVSTFSNEITKIDRTSPNFVSLQVKTNTNEWSKNINTIVKVEDNFAGINPYGYSLEKVSDDIFISSTNNENHNPFLLNVYATQNIEYTPLDIDMETFDVNAYNWQKSDNFTITENGTYNLYARDSANNVTGVQFTIGNIDKIAPTIEKIEKSTEEVTNNDVIITIVGAKDDEIGLHINPYSYDNGYSWTNRNTFAVSQNTNNIGMVLVRDAFGNIGTFEYQIDNIDKNLPSFEDLTIYQNREEKKANITFSFSDDRELYGYVLKTNSSLPQDNEYITSFEIDENGIVSSEYEVSKNGIYHLFLKDKAGNIYPQVIKVDELVTGIDFTQEKVTEYQTIGEPIGENISLFDLRNSTTTEREGAFDTFVYVSQQSTFGVVIPKVIILDGQSGTADYQTSVYGNIAGKETIGIIPNDTFEMKDSDNVKENIVANVSQEKTSFAYNEIVNKTTTNGNISASDITAGRWNGILNFNVLIQNNLYTKDSIASLPSDTFMLEVDNDAIVLK